MIRMAPDANGMIEPRVFCDTCGEVIESTGIVAWSEGDPWPAFYHKNFESPGCDRDNFEYWFELSYFLDSLRRIYA